ncbi:hypothetical protein PPS11_32735 [Pseudomonas putida S11]|nr:hypothetical protein PPS11_32735 [Pseudomonas putida S11]
MLNSGQVAMVAIIAWNHSSPATPRRRRALRFSWASCSAAWSGWIGVGGVTDLAQLGEQARERQLLVIPVQQQAVVGQVQARLGDAGQVAQVLFDQPAAGGAADAFYQQGGLGQVASMANEGLLNVAAVVEGQFVL